MKLESAYKGAKCRGCGRALRGTEYCYGGPAYLPLEEGGGRALVNHYGGYVCSERCDYKAALELEQSMPGHMGQKKLNAHMASDIAWKWQS